jgi:hypothetical protein
MKMGIPITIDDTNMTTDAVAEDYATWGSGTATEAKTYDQNINGPKRCIWENAVTGDLFITVNAKIYVQRGGSGPFALLINLSDEVGTGTIFTSTSSIPINGNYATNKLYTAWFSDLYVIDQTDGSFTTITAPLTTHIVLAHANSTNGDIFSIVVDIATGAVYNIYKMTSTTSWALYAKPSGVDIIHDIDVYENTGDVFVSATVLPTVPHAYKQTAGAGAFSQISGSYTGASITVNQLTGYVCSQLSATSYVSSATGSMVAATITGVSDSYSGLYGHCFFSWRTLSYYIIPESPSASIYLLGNKVFEQDEYCIYNDRLYYALAFSNFRRPGADETVWYDYGATNPYRMFDGTITSPTTATGEINLTLENDNVTAFVFFGMQCDEIAAALIVDTVEVWSETKSLRNDDVGDWWEYYTSPIEFIRDISFTDIPAYSSGDFEITISGASPSTEIEAGLMVCGYAYDVGETLEGIAPGFTNYSNTTIDTFGRISITERPSAKELNCKIKVDSREKASAVTSLFINSKDQKAFWIASEAEEPEPWSLLYGICKRFNPVIDYNQGTYSLQLLGVV